MWSETAFSKLVAGVRSYTNRVYAFTDVRFFLLGLPSPSPPPALCSYLGKVYAASSLPHTPLSRYIESRVKQRLSKLEDEAAADTLSIRLISNVEVSIRFSRPVDRLFAFSCLFFVRSWLLLLPAVVCMRVPMPCIAAIIFHERRLPQRYYVPGR